MQDSPPPFIPQKDGLRLRWSRYHSAFVPAPPGPGLRDRLKAALGAVGGIALTGLVCGLLVGTGAHPLLIAPMGASAVLLFALPASPLAQPWSILGGNIVSALVGVTAARFIPDTTLAAAVAVGAAITLMSLMRCLHPPGGAVALSAALAGPASGYMFAFMPVGINSFALLVAGLLYHRFSGHSYPHRATPAPAHDTRDPLPEDRTGVREEDVEAALARYADTLDVAPEDLRALIHDAERQALVRSAGNLKCGDVMSRDVLTVQSSAPLDDARHILSVHALLSLPVLDDGGRVSGLIRPLDAIRPGTSAADVAIAPTLAAPHTPLADVLASLSDGQRHEVVIVDEDRRLAGLVTQTDVLAALAAVR